MRCFSCDRPVSGDDLDKKTGRFYCSSCFDPTIQEILRLQGKDQYQEYLVSIGEGLDLEHLLFQKDRHLERELENPEVDYE